MGKYFKTKLNIIQEQNQKVIKEVRGMGLLLGLQLKVNQAKFIQKLMKEKHHALLALLLVIFISIFGILTSIGTLLS